MTSVRRAASRHQTPSRKATSTPDREEQIRRRAYELYQQRGKEHGRDLEDWLQAESELTEKKTNKATA